jgi:ribokinase
MDLSFEVEEFPDPGETVMSKNFHTGFGGKGANQAVAAAKTGGHVKVAGAVGNDHYGDQTRDNFERYNMNTEALFQSGDAGTGLASIMVDHSGENQIGVATRANDEFTRNMVDRITVDWFELDFMAGVLEIPQDGLEFCFERAHQTGDAWTVLNAAPAQELRESLWEQIDCLILNESEAEFYTGARPGPDNYERTYQQLLDRGVERVILTLGSHGAYVFDENRSEFVSAPEVEVVDSTGAGDAFVGRYLSARSQSIGPGESLQIAVDYASKSVEQPGTQKSFPEP